MKIFTLIFTLPFALLSHLPNGILEEMNDLQRIMDELQLNFTNEKLLLFQTKSLQLLDKYNDEEFLSLQILYENRINFRFNQTFLAVVNLSSEEIISRESSLRLFFTDLAPTSMFAYSFWDAKAIYLFEQNYNQIEEGTFWSSLYGDVLRELSLARNYGCWYIKNCISNTLI